MKNTLGDLNNHLFAELERLSDEDLEGDKLEKEIRRAEAVCGVATQIIAKVTLVLNAAKFKDDALSAVTRVPRFLLGGGEQ